MSKVSKKFVIVGREDLPIESSVIAKDVKGVLEAVKDVLPGGSMYRLGDRGKIVIYLPGTELPDVVSKAIN